MAADLVRRKRFLSQGSQGQAMEIYGKLHPAFLYHDTDNSVSVLTGDGKTWITQMNLVSTVNFNFILH